ncbi:MAG: NUDIX domain-containing protein [bacterium]|nr:NUDIX domain-containing protein [bacterium]
MSSEILPVRVAAKAVIVKDGQLLAVHMQGSKGEYYMFPGGGHKTGETLEETLRRECREEIGCDVAPGEVLWLRDYREKNHEFADIRPGFHQLEIMFECRLLGEPDMTSTGDTRQVGLAWIPLDEIENWPFWPKVLRARLANGLPERRAEYLGDVN